MLSFKRVFGAEADPFLRGGCTPSLLGADEREFYHCMFTNSGIDGVGYQDIVTRSQVYGVQKEGLPDNPWLNFEIWKDGLYKQSQLCVFPYVKLAMNRSRGFKFDVKPYQKYVEPYRAGYEPEDYTISDNPFVAKKYAAYLTYQWLKNSGARFDAHAAWTVDLLMREPPDRDLNIISDVADMSDEDWMKLVYGDNDGKPYDIHARKVMDKLPIPEILEGRKIGKLIKFFELRRKTDNSLSSDSEEWDQGALWVLDRVNLYINALTQGRVVSLVFKDKYFDLVINDYPYEDPDPPDPAAPPNLEPDFGKNGMIIYRVSYTDYADLWILYNLKHKGSFRAEEMNWLVTYGVVLGCIRAGIFTSGRGYEHEYNSNTSILVKEPPIATAVTATPSLPTVITLNVLKEYYESVDWTKEEMRVARLENKEMVYRFNSEPTANDRKIYTAKAISDRLPNVNPKGVRLYDENLTWHIGDMYRTVEMVAVPSARPHQLCVPVWRTFLYDRNFPRVRRSQQHLSLSAEFQLRILQAWLLGENVLITGATGSGKTDVIPLLFFHFQYLFGGFEFAFQSQRSGWLVTWPTPQARNLVLSVPRRVIVEKTAERYVDLLGLQEEESPDVVDVSYGDPESLKRRIYDNSWSTHPHDKLLVAVTELVFPLFDESGRLGSLVVDEVHEQDLKTIALISISKSRRDTFRGLVLMSATVEGDIMEIRNSFPGISEVELPGGRKFPVCERYMPEMGERKAENLRTLIQTYAPTKGRHALFFLTKQKECGLLAESLGRRMSEYEFAQLHGGVTAADRYAVEQLMSTSPKSVIVMATNYVESSVTLQNLEVVFDFGLVYDMEQQKNVVIDESMLAQRQGRVGRTAPGRYFGLFDRGSIQFKSATRHRAALLRARTPAELAQVPELKRNMTDRVRIFYLSFIYAIYGVEWCDSYMPPRQPGVLEDQERYMRLRRFHPTIPGVMALFRAHQRTIEEYGYNIIPIMNSCGRFAREVPSMIISDCVRMSVSEFESIRKFCSEFSISAGRVIHVFLTPKDIKSALFRFQESEGRTDLERALPTRVKTVYSIVTMSDLGGHGHHTIADLLTDDAKHNSTEGIERVEVAVRSVDIGVVARRVCRLRRPVMVVTRCRIKAHNSHPLDPIVPERLSFIGLPTGCIRGVRLWARFWIDPVSMRTFRKYDGY